MANKYLAMTGVSRKGAPFEITIGSSKKALKMMYCKNKASDLKGGSVEITEFLVCGACNYLEICLVPQYLMENRNA